MLKISFGLQKVKILDQIRLKKTSRIKILFFEMIESISQFWKGVS